MRTTLVVPLLLALSSLAPPHSNAEGEHDTNSSSVKQSPKPKSGKPMKMDEPMATGMAREGMKKGDILESAAKKEKAMKEMMQREEIKK
jgi:hypothetical protein